MEIKQLDIEEKIWMVTCLVLGIIGLCVILVAGILIGSTIGLFFIIIQTTVLSYWTFLPAIWLLRRKEAPKSKGERINERI
jgi:hypothetical protein